MAAFVAKQMIGNKMSAVKGMLRCLCYLYCITNLFLHSALPELIAMRESSDLILAKCPLPIVYFISI